MSNEFETCNCESESVQVNPLLKDIEIEVEDKDDEKKDDEDNSRWSYFVVTAITKEFVSKNDAKRWLQENGVSENKIIRGRLLPVSEKVKRIITIG